MNIQNWHSKKQITIEFPDKQFSHYKRKFNLTSEQEISANILKDIFQSIRNDYLTGTISMDDLSMLCNYLFFVDKRNNSNLLKIDPNLHNVLSVGMELSYYSRQKDSQSLQKLAIFLEDVLTY